MSIALDPKTSRRFITEGDLELDESEQTWWKVRDLNERERVRYANGTSLRQGAGESLEMAGLGDRICIAVKAGLEGYEESHPLKDRHGKPVEFLKDPDGCVSDEFLERIDWSEKHEMCAEIVLNMTLQDTDVEKSEPSPTDS